ncbi:hypothetical protein sos41_24830 [Alphaproteobacteria bacterium SO-S41]|nr:hypothetical protein sos41_24830 [Alphaproteobacteria bacterium SO-S41]
MRRLAFALLVALAGLAPAAATGGEAVEMRDGPGKNARDLEPFWMMRCANGTRLVGLRVHADRRIAGVEAICAGLARRDGAVAWLAKPRVWMAPAMPPPPAPPPPPPPRAEGTVLRAESGTVMRYRGSRALVISVPRAPEPPPRTDSGERDERPRYLLPFVDTRSSRDLLCPSGEFVQGLRTGSQGDELAAIQIMCGDGGAGASRAVGAWPEVKPGKKKGTALKVERIQCGRAGANPLDGTAADAVFGTVNGGRVQSLGITCTPEIAPG